ncbi:MAG: FG-GAP repeat domain-containing protein [Candidatus Brocadiia bacterium]
MRHGVCVLALAMALIPGGPARAFIERVYSLQEVLDESQVVLVGRVASVDPKKRIAVGEVDRALKGKKEFRRIQMNIGVGPADHAKYLLGCLRPREPFVIYYRREGRNLASCVHAGGTWFQLFATDERDRGKVWWRFTHLEVYMGRTYHGPTPRLAKLTADVLAGRARPPKPDPRVPKLDPRRGPPTPGPATASAPPPPGAAGGDGLEALPGWYADDSWARPADVELVEAGERGHVMRVRCGGRADRKLAVTILHHVDLSQARQFALEVDNPTGSELKVAVAFGFAPDWPMYETPPAVVPARATAAPLNFSLTRRHFKTAASNWEHNQPLPNGGRFDKLMLLVEGLPARGTVVFDRVRGAAGGFHRQLVILHGGGEARGVAWADVNGDQRPDLLLCCGEGNVLAINEGQSFADRTRELGLRGGSRAASWADYDGDGHPDLLTSSFQLFTHAGGRFRDDSRLLPSPRGRNPEGAGWIDADGDGRPDVLITNGEHGICLYRNTGRGPQWFQDVGPQAGLGRQGMGRGNGDFVAFADYDGDGYTDFLYNLGDGLLARNQGDGTFRPDTASGIHVGASNSEKRGIAFADYDNDGDLDLFVPDRQKPRLYRNNNDGTFTNVLDQAGDLADAPGHSFAAAWGDVDLDGHLDLFVTHTQGPSRLYLGDGEGSFRDATDPSGLGALAPATGAAFADADGDGDLDLAVNLEGKGVVAFNAMDRAAGRGPLAVRVEARRGAVGAVVRALDPRGRPLGLRELRGAESCGCRPSPVAHFGLPQGEAVVTVALSDGRFARKTVAVAAQGATVTFRDGDFQ